MYEAHFGLTKSPFSMTPEPDLLYPTPAHREALAGLAHGIIARKGFVVLSGEAGTGKTTILARTLHHLPSTRVVSSVILNPMLSESEFIEMMMLDFGFATVPASKALRLNKLQEFLIKVKESGKIAVLVVDEAHKLTPALLEEVRLLSNFEMPGEKLIQIVLSGQPELLDVLSRPDLRQLNQRISVRLAIELLTLPEIEAYIALRWSKCGAAAPPPFAPDTYPEIARWSRGIPRLVNSICDNALTQAYAERSSTLTKHHIEEACRDLWPAPRVQAAAANGYHAVPARVNGEPQVSAPVMAAAAPAAVASPPVIPVRILENYPEGRPSLWTRWMHRLWA
jgi:general secretion pathway protein A